MEISKETARRIYAAHSAKAAPQSHFPAFYLMRLEHPAMLDLYRSWCREKGILPGVPPVDTERLQFELSLLRPEIVEKLLGYADWVEAQREQIGAELLDQHRRIRVVLDKKERKRGTDVVQHMDSLP